MFSKKSVTCLIGILTLSIFLSACGTKGIPDSLDYPVQDFSSTNQDHKKVTLDDLKGKVWVANFIFTNCDDVCLPMTSNMSKLQTQLKKEGIKDVELVSFSIDPTIDKPEVMKQFGDTFRADYSNWHFLTGYDQKYIEDFAVKSFKTMVKKPDTGDQVIHGTDFYLIDEEGTIIKDYAGTTDFPLKEIVKHIKILQNY